MIDPVPDKAVAFAATKFNDSYIKQGKRFAAAVESML